MSNIWQPLLDYSKRRNMGEMICKGCGQFSSAQWCYTCSSVTRDGSVHNLIFGSGLMADNVCDNVNNGSGIFISSVEYNFPVQGSFTKKITVGSGILQKGPDIKLNSEFSTTDLIWGPDILIDKKCTCLTSDLMIRGCTCGGK